jgi:hypothetical protein
VAVTAQEIREPVSRATRRYRRDEAPGIGVPFRLQRYAKVIGGDPAHVPRLHVSLLPTRGAPSIDGSIRFRTGVETTRTRLVKLVVPPFTSVALTEIVKRPERANVCVTIRPVAKPPSPNVHFGAPATGEPHGTARTEKRACVPVGTARLGTVSRSRMGPPPARSAVSTRKNGAETGPPETRHQTATAVLDASIPTPGDAARSSEIRVGGSHSPVVPGRIAA